MVNSICGFWLLLHGNYCKFGEILIEYYRNQDYSYLKILQDAMKEKRGSASMIPLILNLGTR
jgi:hypothetical protein